jgi:hypothetical protein
MSLQSLIPGVAGAALSVLVGTEGALGQSQIHRLAPRGSHRGLAVAAGPVGPAPLATRPARSFSSASTQAA